MEVVIKPHILRELREQRHIPMAVMAKKFADILGVEENAYGDYEAIEKTVSRKDAERIAKIFKRNWTVFLLHKAPVRVNFDHDNRSRYRDKAVDLKTYEALEEAYYLLSFVADINNRDNKPVPAFDKKASAKLLAGQFRQSIEAPEKYYPRFKTDREALSFWIDQLGKMNINVSKSRLGSKDGIRAFSIHRGGKAIIVLDSHDSDKGKIFSLLHEVAHILIRRTGSCDLFRDGSIESYCNNFASEVLIPTDIYRQLIHDRRVDDETALDEAQRVSRRLKVSRLSVLTRFLRDKYISQNTYDELHANELKGYYKQRAAREKREKASEGGPSPYTVRVSAVGDLFTTNILNALSQSQITPFTASKYLGCSVANIDKFGEHFTAHLAKNPIHAGRHQSE